MRETPPAILILEDHPMMVNSVHACLRAMCPQAGIVTAGSVAQAGDLVARRGAPRLVVADLNLPDSSGLQTLTRIRTVAPHAAVVVFSAFEDMAVAHRALDMGASRAVAKSSMANNFAGEIRPLLGQLGLMSDAPLPAAAAPREDLFDALTPRQLRVLAQLATGRSNREIAETLAISEETVRSHVGQVLLKLDLQNRTQASALYLAWAHRHGIGA